MSEYFVFQHNITPDRVVFAYREGDSGSLEVAEYYQSKRGIPSENLIALPCSDSFSISHDEYVETIETPLQNALSALDGGMSSSGQREIWVIILGYNVPVIFYQDDPYDPYSEYGASGIKAIASRLHRLGFSEEDKYPNYIYNRQIFKYFDNDDATGLYITAVINGPSKEIAKSLIDRSIDVDNQYFVSGTLYIDPYGLNETEEQLNYRNDILEFVENDATNLGLTTDITVEPMDGSDSLVAYLRRDNFYWGWFTPRYTTGLLLNQNERRVFLYNADNDAASHLTMGLDENGSDPWCTVAINSTPGYASCAGAVDEPGEENYLRPRPFFKALHQGASLGEAFLLSSPVVDWRIILIGDPLMTVNFPLSIPNDQTIGYTLISNDEAIRLTKESLEESLAYALRQSRLAQELLDHVIALEDMQEELALLPVVNQWRNFRNDSDQYNLLTSATMALVRHISSTTFTDFAGWLIENGEKTTEFMQTLIASGIPTTPISDSLVHNEGSWQYDFSYIHPRRRLENVFFELQIARDSDFTDVAVYVSSRTDVEGWKYEREVNRFVQITEDGFSSSFSGRRIRFISKEDDYLIRTETYFVRWRSVDAFGVEIQSWVIDDNKLIIKR